ncbi:MAG: hypothetical protein IBJ18_05300 [Phycisphaerales bacterium]|nr:hypothetical protein [Phycisphaerales bacterium]
MLIVPGGSGVGGAVVRGVEQLVAELASTELAIRERAQAELAARPDLGLAQIGELLKDSKLSAEARARLVSVGRDIFARTPRGALGVRFRPGMSMIVEGALAGFPGATVFKPGDEIIEINGDLVRGRTGMMTDVQGLRPMVVARDPGQTITVTVMRPKIAPGQGVLAPQGGWDNGEFGGGGGGGGVERERVDLPITLGSFDALNRNNQGFMDRITPEQYSVAWQIRLKDMLGVPTEVAGPKDLAQNQDGQNGQLANRGASFRSLQQQQDRFARGGGTMQRRLGNVVETEMMAGGESQGGRPEADVSNQQAMADDPIFRNNGNRGGGGMRQQWRIGGNGARGEVRVEVLPNPAGNAGGGAIGEDAELTMLRLQRSSISDSIDLLTQVVQARKDVIQRMAEAGMDEAALKQMVNSLEAQMGQIDIMRAQLKSLDEKIEAMQKKGEKPR